MKIVRFLGGLGNQMFQYAFYKALCQRFNAVKVDVREYRHYSPHNGFELDRVFPIRLKHACPFEINLIDDRNRKWKYRKIRRILFLKGKHYEEKDLFSYNSSLFEDPAPKLYCGYWQHHQYVNRVSELLRKEFIFSLADISPNLDLLTELEGQKESVAIHVRRGDYLKDPYLGGLVDREYFEQSISLMLGRLINPKFYIFSDDIPWCKENLPLLQATYVDWNKGPDSYRDMQLMSHCKHAIISNSSFSWWAAWLNTNSNKMIIVPKVWFRGHGVLNTEQMHPDEWIKI